MLKYCPNCLYLGKGKQSLLAGNIYLTALEFFVVIIVLLLGLFRVSTPSKVIAGIAFLLFGIMNLSKYFRGGKICPKCNYKEMLPVDNPDAVKIIKKYDLTLGDNPPPTRQKEPNPDLSNPTKS